jgi:ribosomal protein S18 acetylase RimI-like enzyme
LVVLLFEIGDELVAVGAFQQENERTADFVLMALASQCQGKRLQPPDGRPLAVAVLDELLRAMKNEGYERVIALVARDNERAGRLLSRHGFQVVGAADADYDVIAAKLDG